MLALNVAKVVVEGKQAWPGMQYGAAALAISAPERVPRAEERKSMVGEGKGTQILPNFCTCPSLEDSECIHVSNMIAFSLSRSGAETSNGWQDDPGDAGNS